MNQSVFRLLTMGLSIFAVALFAGSVLAQGRGNGNGGGGGEDPPPAVDFGYNVVWASAPLSVTRPAIRDFAAWTDPDTQISQAIAVGLQYTQPYVAILYDHAGLIDSTQPRQIYTFSDLFPALPVWVPATHTESLFYGVNSSGRVVGVFRDPNNIDRNIGFFFDLNDVTVQLYQIEAPTNYIGISTNCRINELGEVIFRSNSLATLESHVFIFRPGDPAITTDDDYELILDSDGEPLLTKAVPYFNSIGQIVAERASDSIYGPVVRLTLLGEQTFHQEFPDAVRPAGINEFSQFCCRANGVKKNRSRLLSARIEGNGSVVIIDAGTGFTYDINNSGDVMGPSLIQGTAPGYLYFEGNPSDADDQLFLPIDGLVIHNNAANDALLASPNWAISKISDRDSTGHPWIVGSADDGTFDADGNSNRALFLLLPEILP